MTLTRRTTLAFIGGGVIAIGTGGTFVANMSDEQLVHAVLERHLGRLVMARDEMAAFLSDLRSRRPWLFPDQKLSVIYRSAERLGLADITRKNLPGGRGDNLERFERHLLGDFHAQTDVAFRSSVEDPIHYLGFSACLNPFAEFG